MKLLIYTIDDSTQSNILKVLFIGYILLAYGVYSVSGYLQAENIGLFKSIVKYILSLRFKSKYYY